MDKKQKKFIRHLLTGRDWEEFVPRSLGPDGNDDWWDLRKLSFTENELIEALHRSFFSQIAISKADFNRVLFDGTNFEALGIFNSKIELCSFKHSKWWSCPFRSVVVSNCDFQHCDWQIYWKNVKIEQCNFSSSAISGDVKSVVVRDTSFSDAVVSIGDRMETDLGDAEYFDDLDELRQLEELERLDDLDDGELIGIEDDFEDGWENSAIFERCDFSNSTLRESALNGAQFVGCDFSGADFRSTNLRRTTFENCKFDGAMFFASQRDGASFSNSDCRFVDYSRRGDGSLCRYFSIGEFDKSIVFLGSPSGEKRPKLFLCHSSNDKELVSSFATYLYGKGVDIWIDSWEIKAGDSIIDNISRGIESSNFFILFASSSSLESKWVRLEFNAALMKEIEKANSVIIPIKIEDCDLPPLIRDRKYIKIDRVNVEQAFNEVLSRVTRPEHGVSRI